MQPEQEYNLNTGTPSVAGRDASRVISNTTTLQTEQGTLTEGDQGVQWTRQGNIKDADEPQDEEKRHYIAEDDASSSSSSDVSSTTPTSRPGPLRRQQTARSIVAAPYANSWIPEVDDVEKQHSRPRSASSASTLPPGNDNESTNPTASRVSTDAFGNTYPEGGRQAYLCVLGSFSGLTAALGIMNTIGTYQAYLSTHQLRDSSEGSIAWIFGVYAFLSFFCGIQIGPLFDAYGPRLLIFIGSVFLMAAQLLLAQCSVYWHFMLCFGVVGGIGTSLIFTPAISAIGHFFLRRRGQFVGLASTGGAVGGVIFPLTLQALIPRIGFAWSVRLIALLNLILLILANLFIRSRLPPPSSKISLRSILPDVTIFRDLSFTFTTMAVFFTEWALFIPLSYVPSYCLTHGVSTTLSYQLIAVLNAGSSFGRYIPGLVADKIGRFNSIIITIFLCAVFALGLWLPANGNLGIIIAFLCLFGFASGSGIGLAPVCIGQLCKTENLGRYYATCYTVASFATLTGLPIAGNILSSGGGEKGNWSGMILFTGCAYLGALACFTAARVRGVGWSLSKKY